MNMFLVFVVNIFMVLKKGIAIHRLNIWIYLEKLIASFLLLIDFDSDIMFFKISRCFRSSYLLSATKISKCTNRISFTVEVQVKPNLFLKKFELYQILSRVMLLWSVEISLSVYRLICLNFLINQKKRICLLNREKQS